MERKYLSLLALLGNDPRIITMSKHQNEATGSVAWNLAMSNYQNG
jgi:hypothetical protein